MAINPNKSVCLRIGSRCDITCSNITLLSGGVIPWSDSCRYLGVYIKSAKVFKCIFDESKKSLYRSFNAIYGKIGRCASLETVFHLIVSKCLPAFTYGLNACPVNATDRKSLDFALFRIIAKVLGTFHDPVVSECRKAFGLNPITETINKIKRNFLMRFLASENKICQTFNNNANSELCAILHTA